MQQGLQAVFNVAEEQQIEPPPSWWEAQTYEMLEALPDLAHTTDYPTPNPSHEPTPRPSFSFPPTVVPSPGPTSPTLTPTEAATSPPTTAAPTVHQGVV